MSYKTPQLLKAEAERLYADLAPRKGELTVKDRRAIPQQDMPAQEPAARVKNMEEVTYGYSREQAVVEALRCLQCKNAPCVQGCPVRINIPAFVKAVAEENFKNAIDIIKK